MAKYKVEVQLTGVFTTIDVFLEGIEIPLREVEPNKYVKIYSAFEIVNPLDIHVLIKGWIGMKWAFLVRVNDKQVFKKEGEFDKKGYATFTETVNI